MPDFTGKIGAGVPTGRGVQKVDNTTVSKGFLRFGGFRDPAWVHNAGPQGRRQHCLRVDPLNQRHTCWTIGLLRCRVRYILKGCARP
ncbi:hypothetical protein MTBSS4_820002 [Magnetospirillum sp. SS-4]|nr:hypothetical protein MTBSS4_820002 [Magnetospirillum sp. SS-4]